MPQSASKPRIPSFWTLQIGGWLLYAAALAAATIPLQPQRGDVAYLGTLVSSGFIASCLLRVACRKLWRGVTPLLLALLVCVGISCLLGSAIAAISLWVQAHPGGSRMAFHWSYIFAAAITPSFVLTAWSALYFGIKHYQALEEQRQRLLDSQALARDAQLRALRYQLQPHFLFNTLNAISTLVLDEQPRVATQMIAKLADMLRSTLESPDTHHASLAEELAVAEEYLAIEEVRFGPRLSVHFDIASETRPIQIPRFLLQPLIENAIRHGIAQRPQGGQISICTSVLGDKLLLQVENQCVPSGVDTYALPSQGSGLGLSNTRARLEQCYASAATLETRTTPNGNFEVSISIPLSIAESANGHWQSAKML